MGEIIVFSEASHAARARRLLRSRQQLAPIEIVFLEAAKFSVMAGIVAWSWAWAPWRRG